MSGGAYLTVLRRKRRGGAFTPWGSLPVTTRSYDVREEDCYTDAAADMEGSSSTRFGKASPTFTATNKMTIRASIKPESIGLQQDICAIWDAEDIFMLRVISGGTVLLFVNSESDFARGSTVLSAGTAYEVVVVYDGTLAAANRVQIYVDGNTESMTVAGTIPTSLTSLSSSSLSVGYGTKYFDGLISSLGISPTVLSGSDLTAAHAAGYYADRGADKASWETFFNLSERTGACADSVGSNDLTRYNAPGVAVGPATGTCSDASPCKRWENRGGTAANWTQSDIAKQPDYDADADGAGNAGLVFDGVDDTMENALTPNDPSDAAVIGASPSNDTFLGYDSATAWIGHVGADWTMQWPTLLDEAVGTADTNEHYSVWRFSGADSQIRIDGAVKVTGAGGTPAASKTYLGSRGGTARLLDGYVRFVAISPGVAWSAADLAALEAWMGAN